MTTWTQLHSDVSVSSGDGFHFVLLDVPMHEWNHDTHTLEETDFIEQCLPNNKPKVINGVKPRAVVSEVITIGLRRRMDASKIASKPGFPF